MQKDLRCVIHIYQHPIMNAIIMYCIHILIKIEKSFIQVLNYICTVIIFDAYVITVFMTLFTLHYNFVKIR